MVLQITDMRLVHLNQDVFGSIFAAHFELSLAQVRQVSDEGLILRDIPSRRRWGRRRRSCVILGVFRAVQLCRSPTLLDLCHFGLLLSQIAFGRS